MRVDSVEVIRDVVVMNKLSLADLRENYTKAGLEVIDMHPDPLIQFKTWIDVAIESEIVEPNAMTLATADENGVPSARVVLLKHFEASGFYFFTSYTSRKGLDIAQNPHAAIVLHWKELERQICIRGRVEKVPHEVSETYFHMRPHRSQIGAIVSQQSHRIPDRAWLEKREQELLKQYPEGSDVPLPDFWGGFRLVPRDIEFWQGRPSRLHDRIVYEREGEMWKIGRLSP